MGKLLFLGLQNCVENTVGSFSFHLHRNSELTNNQMKTEKFSQTILLIKPKCHLIMAEIDFFFFSTQMTNLLNTLGMGEREGNADE